jgi:hypothetical protein
MTHVNGGKAASINHGQSVFGGMIFWVSKAVPQRKFICDMIEVKSFYRSLFLPFPRPNTMISLEIQRAKAIETLY